MLSRIPMLSKEEALKRGREQGIDDYIAQMNMFRVLLKFPDVAREFQKTIVTLVSRTDLLSHRLRELIIMRVSWLAASEYEWAQHWQASLWLGLTEKELAAVQSWESADCFDERDRIVLQSTDETLLQGAITTGTWANLARLFPEPAAQIAVVSSIANWYMFAQILKNLDIPLEDNAPHWPPDGKGPKPA